MTDFSDTHDPPCCACDDRHSRPLTPSESVLSKWQLRLVSGHGVIKMAQLRASSALGTTTFALLTLAPGRFLVRRAPEQKAATNDAVLSPQPEIEMSDELM